VAVGRVHPVEQSSATPDSLGGRLPGRGRSPSRRRGAGGGGGVGCLLGLCCSRFPPERALRRRPPRNPRARRGHPGERRPGRVRPPRAPKASPRPAWSIPRGAGPGVRHRRRRDADDPPDPGGGGSELLAHGRPPGHERVLAVRGVMLPGVRGPVAPGAAGVQRRLPRAAVPGARVAGDAVIGEARTGGRPVGPGDRFSRSWRRRRIRWAAVLLAGAIAWR
jgi:hypothetical protein